MKINELSSVAVWIRHSAQLVVRQWPVWLLAYGVQFGFTLCLVVGTLLGVGVPVLALIVPLIKTAGLTAVLPGLLLLPVLGLGIFIALQLVSAWAHAAMTLGFARESQGPPAAGAPISIATIFHEALHRLFRAFWMALVLALILCGAAFCFLVPFFVVLPALLPAWYIAVLEGQSVNAALAASWTRTRGLRATILWRVLLLGLLVIGVSLLMPLMHVVPLAGVVLVPLQLAAQLVLPVFFLAAGYVIYREITPAPSPSSPGDTAPLGRLYLLAAWGVMGWIALIALAYVLLRQIPQLQNLV